MGGTRVVIGESPQMLQAPFEEQSATGSETDIEVSKMQGKSMKKFMCIGTSITLLASCGMFGMRVFTQRPGWDFGNNGSKKVRYLEGHNLQMLKEFQQTVGITSEVASSVRTQLDKAQEAADKVAREADEWAQSQIIQNSKTLQKYVRRVRDATVRLERIEVLFHGFCLVQGKLFQSEYNMLQRKLATAASGDPIDLSSERELLQKILDTGLLRLQEMVTASFETYRSFVRLAGDADMLVAKMQRLKKEANTKTGNDALKILGIGFGCFGTFAGGAAVSLASGGSAVPVALYIVACTCSTAIIPAEITLGVLMSNFIDELEKQGKFGQQVQNITSQLAHRADEDQKNMVEVRNNFDTVNALLVISDKDNFVNEVMPTILDLVKSLKEKEKETAKIIKKNTQSYAALRLSQ